MLLGVRHCTFAVACRNLRAQRLSPGFIHALGANGAWNVRPGEGGRRRRWAACGNHAAICGALLAAGADRVAVFEGRKTTPQRAHLRRSHSHLAWRPNLHLALLGGLRSAAAACRESAVPPQPRLFFGALAVLCGAGAGEVRRCKSCES